MRTVPVHCQTCGTDVSVWVMRLKLALLWVGKRPNVQISCANHGFAERVHLITIPVELARSLTSPARPLPDARTHEAIGPTAPQVPDSVPVSDPDAQRRNQPITPGTVVRMGERIKSVSGPDELLRLMRGEIN